MIDGLPCRVESCRDEKEQSTDDNHQGPQAQSHRCRELEPQRRVDRDRRPARLGQPSVRRERLLRRGSEGATLRGHVQQAERDARLREGARPDAGRRGRRGDEGLGPRAWGDPLHPHVPAAHRPDRGEARLVLRARHRLRRGRRLLRQGADPGRAGRLLVPDRRHPGDVRGPRLHGLGPDQPRLPAREPERRPALHPDRLRLLDRRGARREDPAAALDGRALGLGGEGAAPARRRGDPARVHHRRPRAGVLPDRRAVLLRAPRPGHDRADPVRRPAAEGPRARRPLLRLDPRARARLHARDRA